MKNKIGIFILFVAIYHFTCNVDNCRSQWVQMSNGMGNNILINTFTALGNNIFVGTYNYGVFISSNNGLNWISSSLPMSNFHASTKIASYVFFGSFDTVFLSTDNGLSWHPANNGLNNIQIWTLGANENNVFLSGAGHGVFISTNYGGVWTYSGLNPETIWSFTSIGNNIFAATDGGGVFISTNNGGNWTQVNNGLSNHFTTSLTVSGTNIFVGTWGNGVFISTNSGDSWNPVNNGLSNLNIRSLISNGTNVFVGTEIPLGNDTGGIFLSTNNGLNWINKNQGFGTIPGIYTLCILNNFIFAGTEGSSVWRRNLSEIIGIQNVSTEIPREFMLYQNYPNPFNPTTKIKFDLRAGVRSQKSEVKLVIYDIIGREIQTLVNELLQPGTYEVIFDGSNLPSGIYFYQLKAGEFIETKKLILLK
jgi:photosystem II stability/assembly factor-like uncharacterized protein